MNNANVEYKVGDVIEQHTSIGYTRLVRVEEKEADVKNGRPGFSGICVDPKMGHGVWGYDDQVLRVVERG